jgi:hypothetical protein
MIEELAGAQLHDMLPLHWQVDRVRLEGQDLVSRYRLSTSDFDTQHEQV